VTTEHRMHNRPEQWHSLRADVGRRILVRVVVPAVIVYAALVGVGLLLAYPLARWVSAEDGLNRGLAAERSPVSTTVTAVFSTLANTPAVIGMVIVVALAMRVIFGRWGESIILVTAVLLQSAVFLLTTMVVDRRRPALEHLDPAPPTSSFPSGHTGAATALYVGIAVIVAWRVRHVQLRMVLIAVFVAVPVLVALSRLYRGMHHPTDVAFGALNGLACLAVAVYAFAGLFTERSPGARRQTSRREVNSHGGHGFRTTTSGRRHRPPEEDPRRRSGRTAHPHRR
jgi:membrane-associated phospholipid phosphatase